MMFKGRIVLRLFARADNLKCIVIVVDGLCNLLTPLSRLFEKTAGPQLVKKLPTFYDPVLSQRNPVQTPAHS